MDCCSKHANHDQDQKECLMDPKECQMKHGDDRAHGDCCANGNHTENVTKQADVSPESDYYTCPMHPEIKQNKPGKCPKCGGMELVKKSSLES